MRNLNKNNQGSTLVVILLIVLIVVIVGAIGYLVWDKSHKKSLSNDQNLVSPGLVFEMNTSPMVGGACSFRTISTSYDAGDCINQEDAQKIISQNQSQITQAQQANPSAQVIAKVNADVTYVTKDVPAGVYPGAQSIPTKFININKVNNVTIEAKAVQ